MSKKLYTLLAVLVLASMILAASGPTAPPTPEAPKIKACQVTDTGGIDDKSFNQTAYKGITDAIAKYGNVEGKYLESQQQSDYEVNINAFLQDKCDIIITVGFLLADATEFARVGLQHRSGYLPEWLSGCRHDKNR